MQSAMRRGQWQQAAEFADQVLEEHADDAEAIASVARVVFENGDKATCGGIAGSGLSC